MDAGSAGNTSEPQWPGFVRPWPPDFPPVLTQTTLGDLYAAARAAGEVLSGEGKSRAYVDAKAGGAAAAEQVVRAVIQGPLTAYVGRRFSDAIVVSVHAEEVTGRNKLPTYYAVAVGELAGLEADHTIVQANRVHHTGASARQRLARRPTFAGIVRPGRDYVIADDVVTSGSSLAALRHFVEARGARVVLATTLASAPARYGLTPTDLAIRPTTVEAIYGKFAGHPIDAILRDYGVAPSVQHLTESEGRAVLGFRSADALRSSLVAAR